MKRIFAAISTLLTISAPAFAQQVNTPEILDFLRSEKTITQLLAAGYEIKAMAGLGGISFVLQKGPSVAICTMKKAQKSRDALVTDQCMESVPY